MRKSSKNEEATVKLSPGRKEVLLDVLGLDLREFIKQGVRASLVDFGRLLIDLLQEQEVRELVGRRYERTDDRKLYRWGSQDGTAFLMGQKTDIDKLRVRTKASTERKSEEVELDVYEWLNQPDALDEDILSRLYSGVSARQYANTVEKAVRGKGIKKSTISRKGILATAELLKEFHARRFDELDLVALFIDGIEIGTRNNIVCVGLDNQGYKHVLGVRQGATENHIVCRDLLADLVGRGLSVEKTYLFVIDGSKALRKAIKKVFGDDTPVQRCQIHKRRNVEAYLPDEHRKGILQKLTAAYNQKTHKEAEDALDAIYRKLQLISKSAANSLLEGMSETITVHRLGITGTLRKSLSNTNIIESIFSTTTWYSRNVKNWHDEEQIERWVVRGIVQTEKTLNRIDGYSQIPNLKRKLKDLPLKDQKGKKTV